MKARAFLVLWLAAGIAGGPARADTPPPLVLRIANQQQQVTVKREDGRTVFSQKISTSNVKFAGVRLGKQTRLSLQDMAGKTLWKQTVPQAIEAITVRGDWAENAQPGMLAVFAALDTKFPQIGAIRNQRPSLIEAVIGPQNQFVSFHTDFQVQSKPHTLIIQCLPDSYAVRLDQKPPFWVTQPPALGETGR